MIVALMSQKGGVGKSTLAAAVAWELHTRGHSVLVVDADPQGTVVATGEAAAEQGVPAPTIVALGKDMWRPEQLPRLAESYDMVVIDTPGRAGDIQRAALMVSGVAVIPIGQTAADAWATRKALEVVEEAQISRPELQAVLCCAKVQPHTVVGRGARDVAEGAGVRVLRTEITYRVGWQECLGAGMGAGQYTDPVAAEETRALVDELLALGGTRTKTKTKTKTKKKEGHHRGR
ncbi:AAA family ATPase [Myxococcus stipitatus]|uniref:AAA family ATPase n=1 Tax=Myxococcus stipitatus TaxID=83455 RepID=UPI001F3DFF13|nr:AAA family ATPase [Myxococcus stipitatus]MCE9674097.1 AAA family ATPase [Myxococcus stipitatus]